MFIIKNSWFPFGRHKAINIFGFLFTKGDLSEVEINHEKIHTVQQKELLWIPFYILYVFEYLLVRLFSWCNHSYAYHDISFEEEAFRNENNSEYLKTRKYYSWFPFLRIKSWGVCSVPHKTTTPKIPDLREMTEREVNKFVEDLPKELKISSGASKDLIILGFSDFGYVIDISKSSIQTKLYVDKVQRPFIVEELSTEVSFNENIVFNGIGKLSVNQRKGRIDLKYEVVAALDKEVVTYKFNWVKE